ncbi:metalloprotease mig-17-like [Aphidius gifuensis]|uniref:metalloprotease mig-17-like n=1 Tax=Aphidius gifuensis TaxID=684658 RepID=UPI001CDC80A2|nr:metalloprotease mig-17-like [Aphidius gifuensis]
MFLLTSMLVLLSIVIGSELVNAGAIPPTVIKSIESQEPTPTIEVLCFIDYNTYNYYAGGKTGRKADAKVEIYFLSFWKNVDHYFSLLNVRIRLKGLIIAHTKEEENVFLKSHKHETLKGSYDSPAALRSLGKYIYSNKTLPAHDLAILITKSTLCKEIKLKEDNTTESTEILREFSCLHTSDVAIPLRGMCTQSDDDKTVSTSVIIKVADIYVGVRDTVFAIGQSLGIPKDGDKDAEECKSEDGYFMAGEIYLNRPHKFGWSDCSVQAFKNSLNKSSTESISTCLFNKSNKKEIDFSKAPFPGEILSLDNYCINLTGNVHKACNYDDVCTSLTCAYDEDCEDTLKVPAIEGSWCGGNETSTMQCFYGKCVVSSAHRPNKYAEAEYIV